MQRVESQGLMFRKITSSSSLGTKEEKGFQEEGSAELCKIPKNFSQKWLEGTHCIDNMKLLKDLQRAFVLPSGWC